MQLARPDIAPRVAEYLHGQQERGMQWAVYESEADITGAWDFTCFRRQRDAHAFLDAGFANPLHLRVDTIPSLLHKLEENIDHQQTIRTGETPHNKKEDNMNLNNLEENKGYLAKLQFDPTHIKELEEKMAKGIAAFEITDQFIGEGERKSIVDLSVPVRQSGQSGNYFIDRYELTNARAEPLPEGQRYFVVTKNGEKKEDLQRPFTSPTRAIEYFNGKNGERELVMGKTAADGELLVRKEDDKLIYVKPEFNETYHSKPLTQSFYINKGEGFTLPQALNLVQGRSVLKDNLITANGESYKAWVSINRTDPVSTGTGYRYYQFRDPQYGFDMGKALRQYSIPEQNDPVKLKDIMERLRNGDRVPVTMEKNGKSYKVIIETSPKFKNINIHERDGKPLMREFFDRNSQSLSEPKALKRNWDREQKQGMRL
ncbi:hypothetical protein [Parapedobacter sp. DT-150]|uniref:hypothetical protein n=1 Tax=Parapedobacter sp. DT-150 TaxID=3396162 RepID=UPI003F1D0111